MNGIADMVARAMRQQREANMTNRTYINGGNERFPVKSRPLVLPTKTTPVVTDVHQPTLRELYDMRSSGVTRQPTSITVVKNANGDTVKVAADDNGEIIATEVKKPNVAPLLGLGALAYFLLV